MNKFEFSKNCANCKHCQTTFKDSHFEQDLSQYVPFANSGRYKDTFVGFCELGNTKQAQSWWFENGDKSGDETKDEMSCFVINPVDESIHAISKLFKKRKI